MRVLRGGGGGKRVGREGMQFCLDCVVPRARDERDQSTRNEGPNSIAFVAALSSARRGAKLRARRGAKAHGWDDDGEVYDAYQDDDEGHYDDYEGEGEAEAACYGGAVIEDID